MKAAARSLKTKREGREGDEGSLSDGKGCAGARAGEEGATRLNTPSGLPPAPREARGGVGKANEGTEAPARARPLLLRERGGAELEDEPGATARREGLGDAASAAAPERKPPRPLLGRALALEGAESAAAIEGAAARCSAEEGAACWRALPKRRPEL